MYYYLQIVAHEIGHNLNMAHDFINNTPGQTRRDRNGTSCTNKKAVMDYYQVIKVYLFLDNIDWNFVYL